MAKFDVKDMLLENMKPEIEQLASQHLGFQVRFDTVTDLKTWLMDLATNRRSHAVANNEKMVK